MNHCNKHDEDYTEYCHGCALEPFMNGEPLEITEVSEKMELCRKTSAWIGNRVTEIEETIKAHPERRLEFNAELILLQQKLSVEKQILEKLF